MTSIRATLALILGASLAFFAAPAQAQEAVERTPRTHVTPLDAARRKELQALLEKLKLPDGDVKPYSFVDEGVLLSPDAAAELLGGVAGGAGGAPSPAAALLDDPEVLAAWKRLLLSQLERDTQILAERRQTLAWTNWISRGIFVVVHVILAFALWAARREFLEARRTRDKSREQHEVNVSLEGVALKTSLQGVLLLGFALGFYFLYLKFVYPIAEIG
jgi:hypothetical protein